MPAGGRGRRQSQQKQKLARLETRATSAKTVEAAGTGRSPMSHIRSIKWITNRKSPSYKPQAPSIKPEDLHAVNTKSFKLQAEKKNPKVQAPSSKPQASSRKRQAP